MHQPSSFRSVLWVVLAFGLNIGCSSDLRPTAPVPGRPADSWIDRAPMPTGRHGLAVGVVDSTLYAIGGLDSNGVDLAVVEAYDPVADRWTARAPMPTARHGLAAGVINGIIYAVGGRIGANASTVLEAYDPHTNLWSTRSSMPTGRSDLAVAVAGGRMYALGGRTAEVGAITGPGLNVAESYDPASDTWRAEAPMPTARWGLAAASARGLVFALAGFDGSTFGSKVIERFDPAAGSWRAADELFVPRGMTAAGVTTDSIYLIGGTLANLHQSEPWRERCSCTDSSGEFSADLPQAVEGLAVGVVLGKIYAVGGSYISGSATPDTVALHTLQEYTP